MKYVFLLLILFSLGCVQFSANSGNCTQILQPANACNSLAGVNPIYLERGQTATINGQPFNIPLNSTEVSNCFWLWPQNNTNKKLYVALVSHPNDLNAENYFISQRDSSLNKKIIDNETFSIESINTSKQTTRRLFMKRVDNYIISIDQTFGVNDSPLCNENEELAVGQTFRKP